MNRSTPSKVVQISSVQFGHSVVSDSVTPQTAAHQVSLSITNSWSLLKLMSIESVMSSNHLILCHPLCLLPSIFPSFRVFSNESVLCIRWSKCWSFRFSISPSNEYWGLISFRIDWFDLPPFFFFFLRHSKVYLAQELKSGSSSTAHLWKHLAVPCWSSQLCFFGQEVHNGKHALVWQPPLPEDTAFFHVNCM